MADSFGVKDLPTTALMDQSLAQHYLEDAIATLRGYKQLADLAIDQLQDDEYFVTLDAEANSVAVIMKHIAGNMLSRWTDFLTSDGEKPERDRDLEFIITRETSSGDLRAYWESGWQCLFNALEPLRPGDFHKQIRIRGEAHSIVQAINRQLTHYAYHVGQITFLAKHFRSSEWQSLSVPRNRSAEFNQFLDETSHKVAKTEDRFNAALEFARGSEVKEK